jgi:hypothetical protein
MQPMKVPSYSLGSGRPDTTDQAIGADIDPELECQLAQASGDQAVEAVFFLRQDGRGARRQDRLSALLKLAGERQPAGAVESTYLPKMGALIVRACPTIIRQLIAQPEVEVACANRSGAGVLLESAPEAACAR